jgi:uncharacterized integral membrane protein (TIGR00697 family)
MFNIVLWLLFALVNFGLIVLAYRLFGKVGLFSWIAFGTVLANIQVVKTIEIGIEPFALTATLGNIMYGTLFLVTDALGEKYSKKDAYKAVQIGFFSLLSMLIIMQISIWFTPSTDDFAQASLETIFGIMPFIALGSLTAYIVSQTLDVLIFDVLKKRTNGNQLWKRNIGSTLISQFIDTLIFVPIAFGLPFLLNLEDSLPFIVIRDIFFTTYFIKVIVAFLDTPFIYLIKNMTPKNTSI